MYDPLANPRYHYATLLIVVLFFFILTPFLEKGAYATIFAQLSIIAFLVYSVYSICDRKSRVIISAILALPATLSSLSDLFHIYDESAVFIISLVFSCLFFSDVLPLMLGR